MKEDAFQLECFRKLTEIIEDALSTALPELCPREGISNLRLNGVCFVTVFVYIFSVVFRCELRNQQSMNFIAKLS